MNDACAFYSNFFAFFFVAFYTFYKYINSRIAKQQQKNKKVNSNSKNT